jgi:hypothetical protein
MGRLEGWIEFFWSLLDVCFPMSGFWKALILVGVGQQVNKRWAISADFCSCIMIRGGGGGRTIGSEYTFMLGPVYGGCPVNSIPKYGEITRTMMFSYRFQAGWAVGCMLARGV